MSGLTPRLRAAFAGAYDKIRKGELKTFIPFLCMFRLNGKPLDLKLHYQFAPMFNTVQPAHSVYMCGRQVGKSYGICEDSEIRSGVVPYYHTLIVQPRADQIQRLASTVYKPLLMSSPIRDVLISNVEMQKMALREYRSGSLCYMEHTYMDQASRLRGISGCAATTWDESVTGDTEIMCVEFAPELHLVAKKIRDIKGKTFCVSFANDTQDDILVSVVQKDASFHGVRSCFRVTTVSGRVITCTADHLLPTNKGAMRLSDVIEYEFARRSQTGRNERNAAERHHGDTYGGRRVQGVRSTDKGACLEPRRVATGLSASEIRAIARVRDRHTTYRAESRLREILVSLLPEKPWHIALDVYAAAPGRMSEKDHHERIPGTNNAPDSPGVVVHGRRISRKGLQLCDDIHELVLGSGERTIGQMAEVQVGYRHARHLHHKLVDRKHVTAAVRDTGRLRNNDESNTALCTGVHEVQDRIGSEEVSGMRQGFSAYRKFSVLLEDLRYNAKQTAQEGVRGRTSGAEKSVQANAQGAEKRKRTSKICAVVPGKEGRAERVCQGMAHEEPGKIPGHKKGIQGTAKSRQIEYDRIQSIEYIGEQEVYDIEVVGTHNYVLANGICSYNCQDIEYEAIDIGNETMSASRFWGFARYTGTPKTTDTTLALLWNRSSQAEWVIRCTHCGHMNIPNPEHDLLKMLGKKGPVCAKCGKWIDPRYGGYVHAIPDRINTFPGYHISQTIHPLHVYNVSKWLQLMEKVARYEPLVLYNETFGWPYDAATSPLTMSDLQKATYDFAPLESPSDITRVLDHYRYVTVGIDWSGGGAISDSYTVYAVLGLRNDSDVIDVLYAKRIPKGVSPSDEAKEIMYWIIGTGADAVAYDNGGAGFTRLEIMKHQGLMDIPNLVIVPINYIMPSAGDVMKPHAGQREADLYYYTLDKTRSLSVVVTAIKSSRIRTWKFKEEDKQAVQQDLLALREDPHKTQRGDTVIIIIKKPSVPDDFAHAVNFGCSQIWDHFGAYPRIGTRYDTTELTFDENHNPILPDDVFGPRGDFERFKDAVDMRAAMVETEGVYGESPFE